jgi:predicted ATP-binding protein involved in virulence
VAKTPIAGLQQENPPERLLAAVNLAVDTVIEPETGWHGLHWNTAEKMLFVAHKDHGLLPLSYLSDGIRNTVALVADVAHRCARLNPHFVEKATICTPGILLIDEVDLHLHPEWQQRIIRMLQTVFPNLQLILSTHSPQVLSTVDASQIRLIDTRNGGNEVATPHQQTQGIDSADVLSKVMDVHSRPDVPPARWLSEYRAMVQTGEHESGDGRRLWAKLVDHFGTEHPELLQIDTVRRFHIFKRQNNIP